MVQIHRQAHIKFILRSISYEGFLTIGLYKTWIMIFIFFGYNFLERLFYFYEYFIVEVRVLELVDRTNLSFVDVMS